MCLCSFSTWFILKLNNFAFGGSLRHLSSQFLEISVEHLKLYGQPSVAESRKYLFFSQLEINFILKVFSHIFLNNKAFIRNLDTIKFKLIRSTLFC